MDLTLHRCHSVCFSRWGSLCVLLAGTPTAIGSGQVIADDGQENIPLATLRVVPFGMPTVLRIGSYRFHFYTDEGNEPPHIHVRTPDGDCKFWLEPSILLASNRGVRPHDLRQIERLVFENQQKLKEAYYERHSR